MYKNQQILIVDDDPVNLNLLECILKESYEVFSATSGLEALKICAGHDIDLILLDVMMPDMDGHEVCRKLKTEPVTKNIPVIFLTAKAETSDILLGFEAGGIDYITKPFIVPELLARVKTHVFLKKAIDEIKTLRGLLPVCAYCKKVREEDGSWEELDKYIQKHSYADVSHGICEKCLKKHFPEESEEIDSKRD